tara:strand:+ start:2162 stop:4234 length:2073 start_codon:yes stop_codon:yes gene_type:complete
MIIYLGDLFHTWTKGGIWTIPLNIGYVASYTQKKLKEKNIDCEIKLFKDANLLLKQIEKKKPDVVGLGFFVWNENLNKFVMDDIKEKYPEILTIGGGTRFTNINTNIEGAKNFFTKNLNCDLFVVNQGEKGFFNVVEKFIELKSDISELKKDSLPGCLVNKLKDQNKVSIEFCNHDHDVDVGENIGALDDLNEIPSPYLNGMLDEFFDDRWMPVLETNRSCPYRCTFCAWGIGTQKLMKFDEQRVLDEIEYISKKCKKSKTLIIADANFGILERDAMFAKKMYEMSRTHDFPFSVNVQWNKTRPDRVYNVAKEFKNIAAVGASMQTLNPKVLEAIKRKNLTVEQVLDLQEQLKKIGIGDKSFTELIIGLPEETKESHLYANRKLIDLGFEVWNYSLHLLPGTEMDTTESRKKYFKKTGFRLHDNSYGLYKEKKIFEAQETILKTNTLSVEDFKFFRFFHFLIQMMWSKKNYYYLLVFLKKNYDIHQVDFITDIIENIDVGEKIFDLYKNFMSDYEEAESFEKEEDLFSYWSKKENFSRLEKGEYGKLNMLYTYKIILGMRDEFSNFLMKVLEKIKEKKNITDKNFEEKCKELLKFQNCKFVQFNSSNLAKNKFNEYFSYDILSWIDGDFSLLNKFSEKKQYNFYFNDNEVEALNTQLKQNKSKNLNSKLRDMTVYTSTKMFFYNVTENNI